MKFDFSAKMDPASYASTIGLTNLIKRVPSVLFFDAEIVNGRYLDRSLAFSIFFLEESFSLYRGSNLILVKLVYIICSYVYLSVWSNCSTASFHNDVPIFENTKKFYYMNS